MKYALPVLFLALTLGGCAPITDVELKSATPSQLCSWSVYRQDETVRLSSEIARRGVDCDPAALSCSEQGLRRGSVRYTKCVADYQKQEAMQAALDEKRAKNPDWAYCSDKGFSDGSTAMAVCLQDFHEQERYRHEMWARKQMMEQHMQQQQAQPQQPHAQFQPRPTAAPAPAPQPQVAQPAPTPTPAPAPSAAKAAAAPVAAPTATTTEKKDETATTPAAQ